MTGLTQNFNICRRDEILEICDTLAKTIANYLEKTDELARPPILIIINGHAGAGKSIFWDRIREKIFLHGGIFIRKDSESNEKNRLYETWLGQTSSNSPPLKYFCANMHRGDEKMKSMFGPEILHLMGDVVILSNVADGQFPKDQIAYEINLSLTEASTETPPELARWQMEVSLRDNLKISIG